MSQRINQLSKKPRVEERILRTELLAKKMQISELSKELDNCEIEIEKKNITISVSINKFPTYLILSHQNLKRKACWLNVAIDNVNEKYSDCKDILVVRDNTLKALRQSLNFQGRGAMILCQNQVNANTFS